MAVKQNNSAGIIGGIMTAIGGVMVFSSFSSLTRAFGAFMDGIMQYGDFEYAFQMGLWVGGGGVWAGIIGIILLFVGIMTSRAAAAQAARSVAQKGGEAYAAAKSEAEQRAREQQRAMEERAKQASRDAQARVQQRQQAMAAGGQGGQGGGSGSSGSSGSSRLDELRNRFANDPRMEQVRQQAQARGYGDIADRYLPRATPQQQAQGQGAQRGGQNAHSGDGYGSGQNQPQHANPARQQHSQPAQAQQRPQVAMQRPGQPAPGQPRQPQRPVSRNQQDRIRQQAKADAQAAKIAADAFTQALQDGAPRPGYGDARKRQSALVSSALNTTSLSRTSLSTSSLLGSGRRTSL